MSNFKNLIWMGIGAAFGFATAKYMNDRGMLSKEFKDKGDTTVDYVEENEVSDEADIESLKRKAQVIANETFDKMVKENTPNTKSMALQDAREELGFRFITPIGFKDRTTAYRVAALAMWEIEQNTVITVGQLSRLAKEEGVDIHDERIAMENYGWMCTDDIKPFYNEVDDLWVIVNNCPTRIYTNDGEEITTRS